MLQNTASHCNTLPHYDAALHIVNSFLWLFFRTAITNTLQSTSNHCNTLPHYDVTLHILNGFLGLLFSWNHPSPSFP